MNLTFEELRSIKHKLPTGSIKKIAQELSVEEQTVRNYFGASKFEKGAIVERYIEPGPGGGIVHLQDPTILNLALKMIEAN